MLAKTPASSLIVSGYLLSAFGLFVVFARTGTMLGIMSLIGISILMDVVVSNCMVMVGHAQQSGARDVPYLRIVGGQP